MARLHSHRWLWRITASLCVFACSACTNLGVKLPARSEENQARLKEQEKLFAEKERLAMVTTIDAESPYHKLPIPPESPREDAAKVEIHKSIYPPQVDPEIPSHDLKPSDPSPKKLLPVVNKQLEKVAVEEPLVVALRCILDKHLPEAVKVLNQYDKPNQELLLYLLPLAVQLTQTPLTVAKPEDVTAIVEQLRSMAQPLQKRTELVINKICFCENIRGFGDYKPVPSGHPFQAPTAGRPGELVQVYVELSNLLVELENDVYQARLASAVAIRRHPGERPIWRHAFQDRNHLIRSWSLRHDFFNNYMFYVPNLPPGAYTLSIEVVDVPTGRKAVKSLKFRVTTVAPRDV
jgi:hypothetical protein